MVTSELISESARSFAAIKQARFRSESNHRILISSSTTRRSDRQLVRTSLWEAGRGARLLMNSLFAVGPDETVLNEWKCIAMLYRCKRRFQTNHCKGQPLNVIVIRLIGADIHFKPIGIKDKRLNVTSTELFTNQLALFFQICLSQTIQNNSNIRTKCDE